MTSLYKDKIGYLPYNESIEFSKGGVYPLDCFDKAYKFVNKRAHKDGFYYPPIVEDYRQEQEIINGKVEIREEPIPKTRRPADLFKMPASHEIRLINPDEINNPRKNDGLFIVYLVAFIFNVRLQFSDWRFDGRLQINIRNDFLIRHSEIEYFIDKAYEIWKEASVPDKLLLTNLLYMHTKIQSYEWDWERFAISYMVFDGCYKFLREIGAVSSSIPHKKRIEIVLQYYAIKINQEKIKQIVRLRNDLFHETLWDSGQPGEGSTHAYRAALQLSKLNRRILFAIFGHRGEYIQSPWWIDGTFAFTA